MYAAQTVPDLMRALVYDSGSPGKMAWQGSMKVPQPGKHQVLVKVDSASLNPADFRATESRTAFLAGKGHIVGRDMAGTIVAIGRDVRGFAVGDKVFGLAPGVANYTLAEINRITNVPQGANVQDYGIVGLAGTVANQILTKHWFDRPDYTVRNMLVIGASGGVGSSLVQIARAAGGPELTIYGVTSGKNMAYVKEIGASQAIDYTTPNFDLGRVLPIHSVDLIVDVVSGVAEGPTYVDRGMPLLKQSGRYVALNSTSSFDWFRAYLTDKCGCNMQRSKYDLFISNQSRPGRDLQAIAGLIQQGEFRLAVSQELPLAETPIRRALHTLKQRHVRGKVKIVPEQYSQSV